MVKKRVKVEELEKRKRTKKDNEFVDDSSSDEDVLNPDKEYLKNQDSESNKSDESDELESEFSYSTEVNKFNDNDIKFEAFNMEKEYRKGKFNEAGTYIKNYEKDNNDNNNNYNNSDSSSDSSSEDDEENVEDHILKNVDEESIKKAKIAEAAIFENNSDKNSNENKKSEVNESLKNLYTLLNKEGDENAASLMQRLYMKVKKNNKNKKKKSKKKLNQTDDDCIDATTKLIDEVTQYVAILEPNFVDILWTSREALSKLLFT